MLSVNRMTVPVAPVSRSVAPEFVKGEISQGKNLESIGHRAKAEVVEFGDTAPNAIGKAAALLAKMHVDASEVPTT